MSRTYAASHAFAGQLIHWFAVHLRLRFLYNASHDGTSSSVGYVGLMILSKPIVLSYFLIVNRFT